MGKESQLPPPGIPSNVSLKKINSKETFVFSDSVLIGKIIEHNHDSWEAVLLRIVPRTGKVQPVRSTPSVLVEPFKSKTDAIREIYLYCKQLSNIRNYAV